MQEKVNKIYNIDNIDFLKTLPDNSISLTLTDIPYALNDVDALKMIQEGLNNKGDFLNKKWILPTVDFLKECHRVLKTGSYFITTFTPRQDLQAVLYYRLLKAGFDINFSPIYWAYTSGFPKASSYSKSIDKYFNVVRNITGINVNKRNRDNANFTSVGNFGNNFDITEPLTKEAIYCDGLYSNSLKPAVEVIVVAQKPFQGAKYQQALTWYNECKALLDNGIKEEDLCFYTKNASGGIDIDKVRIPIENLENEPNYRPNMALYKTNQGKTSIIGIGGNNFNLPDKGNFSSQGRFPPNLLVSDDCVDVGKNIKSVGPNEHNFKTSNNTNATKITTNINSGFHYQDQADFSRYFSLDSWTKKHHPELYKLSKKTLELQQDAEKTSPFLFTSKPSTNEKNIGLESVLSKQMQKSTNGQFTDNKNPNFAVSNTHCTVKPIALFNYLITMFSAENDIILDPYCGSGTTCISAVLTNRKYIGLELKSEYVKIAEERVKYWSEVSKQSKCKNKLADDNIDFLFD